jgi:hypothetical protein
MTLEKHKKRQLTEEKHKQTKGKLYKFINKKC